MLPTRQVSYLPQGGHLRKLAAAILRPAASDSQRQLGVPNTTHIHSITIADNRLYVATQTSYIDIWDISNPYSPIHKGAYALPDPVPCTNYQAALVHEMYVDPNGHRAYVAYTRGGLFIINIDTGNVANSHVFKRQMYDSDKRSALDVFAADTAFDYRTCHSAWPTDDREYIFTTDEIASVYSEDAKYYDLILNM